ncbi:MAG: response regulator [Clostridia bacterium]
MASGKVTVVIADDEQLICTLLKQIIYWDALNLQLVGVAHNGKELLQTILDQSPDIVITDICMPEMDGIDLIRSVRQRGIPCHFIIVSGYRLFEYAHNALKYNVEDYLLKPIDNVALNERLRELSVEILQRQGAERANAASEHEGYRRFFLNRVVDELDGKDISLEEIEREYGVAFVDGYFQVISVVLDAVVLQKELADDAGSLEKKLSVAFERMLKKYCVEVLTCVEGNRIEIGLNFREDQMDNIRQAIDAYSEYAKEHISLFDGVKVTIGIGNAVRKVSELKKTKDQAASAVCARIVLGLDRVIRYDNLACKGASLSKVDRARLMERIKRDYEIWDATDFSDATQALFALIRENFCVDEARSLYMEVVELFFETCGSTITAYSNEDYLRKQIHCGMLCASTISIMEHAITDPILGAMENLMDKVHKQEAKPIRQAMRYLEENFSKTIRLEDMAEMANLSSTYFSNLFKKETGENLTDYLVGIRMQKAKELLSRSGLNIAEIADHVGYADSRYFSKLFMKVVGIKPTEYRKIYG